MRKILSLILVLALALTLFAGFASAEDYSGYTIRIYSNSNSTERTTWLIQEAKVAVLPGTLFGAEGYIRISYSAPMGMLKAGMNRFEEFVKGLK